MAGRAQPAMYERILAESGADRKPVWARPRILLPTAPCGALGIRCLVLQNNKRVGLAHLGFARCGCAGWMGRREGSAHRSLAAAFPFTARCLSIPNSLIHVGRSRNTSKCTSLVRSMWMRVLDGTSVRFAWPARGGRLRDACTAGVSPTEAFCLRTANSRIPVVHFSPLSNFKAAGRLACRRAVHDHPLSAGAIDEPDRIP